MPAPEAMISTMTTLGASSHDLKVNAIDVEGVAPPLATIAKLDPALGRTLAARVDTSVYTDALAPARIFGERARAALSPNDFARFAAIADGTERIAIEQVGRRANTVMVVCAAAITIGLATLGYSELGMGATAALELTIAATAVALIRAARRSSDASSSAIELAMVRKLEQLPPADGL